MLPAVLGRAVGVNDQVFVVLLTVALPSRVVPLKMRRVSPVARAAEMVPLMVGVMSSEKALAATLPWIKPMSSATAVIAAVVLGAVVSSVKERVADAVPRLPAASATRAVMA